MSPTPLQPRKEPRQARSQATVETILQAAARILGTESLAGFNTNRVAEVAGISIGSLYQYFPNKTALLVALIEREHERLAVALEAVVIAASSQPLHTGLQQLVRLAIDQQNLDPMYAAALDHEERRLPVSEHLANTDARLVESVLRFLSDHRGELRPDRISVDVARDLLVIARALVDADAQDGHDTRANLQARLMRALTGYLLIEMPRSRDGKRTPTRQSARPAAPVKRRRAS